MNRLLASFFVISAVCALACDRREAARQTNLCSHAWYRSIEERVPTSDAQQHGPDVGSDEWKSVIEFKLGIRDKPGVPSRDSHAWCSHIDQLVRESRTSSSDGGD